MPRVVAVDGQGYAPLVDHALKEHQVGAGVLGGAEDGLNHGAGGLVRGDEQRQLWSSVLQSGVLTAVDLNQHSLLGSAATPEPVLLGASVAGNANAGLDQNAAHRRTAQVDTLPFPKQLGEVGVVCPGVAVAGPASPRQPQQPRGRCCGAVAPGSRGPVQQHRTLGPVFGGRPLLKLAILP